MGERYKIKLAGVERVDPAQWQPKRGRTIPQIP